MRQRYRSGWDTAGAVILVGAASIAVLVHSHDGLVAIWAVLPVLAVGLVAGRLMFCVVELDETGLIDRRPWRRLRLSWDDIERFVISDRKGRCADAARGRWRLVAECVDGSRREIIGVRGLTIGGGVRRRRAGVLADELCTWHAMRTQLRQPIVEVLRPPLRALPGAS